MVKLLKLFKKSCPVLDRGIVPADQRLIDLITKETSVAHISIEALLNHDSTISLHVRWQVVLIVAFHRHSNKKRKFFKYAGLTTLHTHVKHNTPPLDPK